MGNKQKVQAQILTVLFNTGGKTQVKNSTLERGLVQELPDCNNAH
jgi:hypothetical protein